jgi:hypothetical protein
VEITVALQQITSNVLNKTWGNLVSLYEPILNPQHKGGGEHHAETKWAIYCLRTQSVGNIQQLLFQNVIHFPNPNCAQRNAPGRTHAIFLECVKFSLCYGMT